MLFGDGLSRTFGTAAFAALVVLHAGGARAQFEMGFGFYQPGSMAQGMLNSWALQNGARATMGPVQNNVYAKNPNAYINQLHEAGYGAATTRRGGRSRRASAATPTARRRRTTGRASQPAGRAGGRAAQPPAPVVPLSSFFDRYQKLVWPGGSPDFGDLAAKRTAADLACLGVLNDYNLHGLAQVGTVTEARSKLVEYGRPALQYIRDNSTPRVADTFHLFLLSLYESLAQAATIPKTPSPSPVPVSAPPAPRRPPRRRSRP